MHNAYGMDHSVMYDPERCSSDWCRDMGTVVHAIVSRIPKAHGLILVGLRNCANPRHNATDSSPCCGILHRELLVLTLYSTIEDVDVHAARSPSLYGRIIIEGQVPLVDAVQTPGPCLRDAFSGVHL